MAEGGGEKLYLAIDIGGTFTKFGLLDGGANILEKDKLPSRNGSRDEFFALIRGIYERFGSRGIEGIALSVPSAVDVETGVILENVTLSCMYGRDIVSEISELCGGIPVSVENDGKAAGLAETWVGAAKDVPNCVVLGFGTAIAGCVIIDHKALRGARNIAGEFSYLPSVLRKDDYRIMGYEWSTKALTKKASALLCRSDSLSGEELFELYYAGNEKITKLFDDFFFHVACQCYSLQSVVDPDLFCIGGGISEQPCVVPGIQAACHYIFEHAKNPQQREPKIVACRFNNDSNLIGALYSHLVKYGKL